MPRLASNGSVLAGIAGVVGTINGKPIFPSGGVPSGGACWLVDGQSVIVQADPDGNDHWSLWRCDVGAEPVKVDDEGADFLAASGTGQWAALFRGQLRTSWGHTAASEAPIAGGSGFIVTRSHVTGANMRVYRDGALWLHQPDATPDGPDQPFAVIRDGLLAYRDKAQGYAWIIWNLETRELVNFLAVPGVDYLVPAKHPDGLLLLERNERADLTLRIGGDVRLVRRHGGAGDETFNPDLAIVDGRPMAAWSSTPGEEPENVIVTWRTFEMFPRYEASVPEPPQPPSVPDCTAVEQRAKDAEARLSVSELEREMAVTEGRIWRNERDAANKANDALSAENARLLQVEASYQRIPAWIRRIYR